MQVSDIKKKASEMLLSGEVKRVIGWKKGEFDYDLTPATFESVEELEDFVYDGFCGANLSKYLIKESKKEGKTLVFMKPCDTYSFNQLLKEHRIVRDNVYVVAIDCEGKLDIDKIKSKGIKGILSVKEDGDEVIIDTIYGESKVVKGEVMLEKCLTCKSKEHVAYDESMAQGVENVSLDRFSEVAKLEAMTADERYEFWRGELSKCIRCNACRNVCPACSCVKCVFDNDASGVSAKSNANEFEESMFHIIRAFHVAGRCTDCGECSRVCPQHIPLHLINRKFIKDINTLYGEYQAGADVDSRGPLTNYTTDDLDPSDIFGGNK
ncbi:MAG: 4Fe-4S dicluster domain-containing protein [Clostridia bacterium]|nr:4Fe-4S dicluster domain-containing protein [Clostridia bacterium]MBR7159532.1 4Fe-4S dicluster domain-containing protein [Clostridia bacterium]